MISQHTDWIIVFNSSSCQVYEHHNKPAKFKLLKEFNQPENKLKDMDLTSDKPGRYKSSSTARGSFTQPSDPKEIKIEKFIRKIAEELDQGRNQNCYQNLIIIAADHMNGLLYKHLNKHIKELVKKNIKKDLTHATSQELLSILEIDLPPFSKKIS